MKLHLPKRLLTALLAAFTAFSLSTGSAAWGAAETVSSSITWSEDTEKNYEAGEYLTVQGGGVTLTIDGGTITGAATLSLKNNANVIINDDSNVTISRLVTHDSASGGTSESVTLNGGVLNITDSDTGSYNFWTAVLIGHWGSSPSTSLNVNGGQLNVLNGTVQLGFDSAGSMVVTGGTANIKKLNVNKGSLTLSGGRLNIGSDGLVGGANQTATLTGGTLGVLDAGGWSLGNVTTTIGTITIDTNVWDATTNTSTNTGANINLIGNIQAAAGGMNITLDGTGSLTINRTLAGTITTSDSAKVILASNSDWKDFGATYVNANGESSVSGFVNTLQVAQAGATFANSQIYIGDTAYTVTDGIADVRNMSTFYYVNDMQTYGSAAMSGASAIHVYETGTLVFTEGLTPTLTVTNKGKVVLQQGANDVNVNTLLNTVHTNVNNTATGSIDIETTGNTTITGGLTIQGAGLVIKGGTLSSTNKNIDGGKLVLDGVQGTIGHGNSGDSQEIDSALELKGNTVLHLRGNGVFNYGSRVTISGNSILDLGAGRHSLNNSSNITMAGGTIYGAGEWYGSTYIAGLDYFESATITVSDNSLIATSIASRDSGDVVTFNVAANKTLTLGSYTDGVTTHTADLVGSGSFKKDGAGTLLYQGADFNNNLNISSGIFEYNHTNNRTYSGTLSGSGTFKKSGTGTLLLSAASSSIGTLNASGGITQISGALTVNSVTAGNGQVVVLEDGVLSFTNISGTENLKNILALTGDKLVTKGDSYLLLAPTINNTTGDDVSMTADMVQRSNVVVNGRLDLHGRSWDSNHANGHVLTIDDASFLKIGTNGTHELRLVGRAKINVTNGSSLYAGKVVLGYDTNQGTSSYGALTISSGSATLQEIEYRLNTGNSFEMTGGHVEFTGANIITRANDNSVGSFAISGGKLLVNTDQALTQSGNVGVTLGGVDLQIAAEKTLTLGGTLNITGTMTHNSKGTLKFADGTSLVLTSDNLKALQAEGIGVAADTNGLGTMKYCVVTGAGITSYGSNITLTVNGSSEGYSFTDGGIVVDPSSEVYIINTTKHTADTDSDFIKASAYHVNADGVFTLQANIPGGKTVANILTTTTGTGKLSITAGSIGVNSGTSVFQGDVWVESGCNLTLGNGADANINFSSLNSMVLNGGNVTWKAMGSNLKKLDVQSNSNWTFFDMKSGTTLSIGTLSVAAGATLSVNKTGQSWKQSLNIEALTGQGSVFLNGPGNTSDGESTLSSLQIGSLAGFSGNLEIATHEFYSTKFNRLHNRYNATVNTGISGATLGSLSFVGYGESGEESTAIFNVQGDTQIGTLSATGATVNITAAKTLTLSGGNAEAPVTHSISTLTGGFGSKLNLAENAVLNTITSVTSSVTMTGSGTYHMASAGQANLTGWTDSANWTGTVVLNGMQLNANNTQTHLAKLGNENSTIELSNVWGWIMPGVNDYVYGNLKLKNGANGYALKITDGYSNQEIFLKGDISGDGNLHIGTSTGANGMTFNFSGDISEWKSSANATPEIKVVNGGENYTIKLTESANTVNVALNKGAGTLDLTVDTAATFNEQVDVNTLTVNQNATFNNVLQATSASVAANKVLTLAGGTDVDPVTHSINSLTSASGSSISISENAELVLSSLSGVSGKIEGAGTLNLALNGTVNGADGIPTGIFAGSIDTVKLTNGTCMEITGYGQMSAFNNIANLVVEAGSTFSNRLTGQTIGLDDHTLTLAGAGGISGKPAAALAFGHATSYKGNMIMAHAVQLVDNATVWTSPDRVGILSGTVNGKGHVLTKTGSGELQLNGTVTDADLEVSEGTLTINGTATGSESVVVNGGTLKLGSATSSMQAGDKVIVTVNTGKTAATMQNVQLSDAGIVSTDKTGVTKGSLSDAELSLEALAAEASFTIKDMSLSNVTIAAANAETKVNLSGVTAIGNGVNLSMGSFTMTDKVDLGAAVGTYSVEGKNTASFTTSQLSGITLNNAEGASLTVNLDALPESLTMGQTYDTLTIVLDGFSMDTTVGKGLIFAEDSWLGRMLADQNAEYVNAVDSPEVSSIANNNTVTVTYTAMTGGNVGTIITITGLTIPEPATSTLSLLALAGLAARRRRQH